MAHLIGRIRRRARKPVAGGSPVRLSPQAGRLQGKLQVGPQNDAYEREADAVAAQVMNTPDSAAQRACAACEEEDKAQRQTMPEEEEETLQAKAAPEIAQRQTEEEDEETLQAKRSPDALQRQPEAEEDEEVQAKARADSGFQAPARVSARIAALKGSGAPLGTSTRAFFEPRFGADFSQVRVHTGPEAQRAARGIGARAFTTGRDVVFGAGEYAPQSREGGTLLAHELTHVLQQGAAGRRDAPAQETPVRRWAIGAAPVPAVANWQEVPDGTGGAPDHAPRLNEARGIVSGLLGSTRCQNYFRDNCEGGTQSSLRDAFDAAQVYHIAVDGNLFGQNRLGTGNIAYNRKAYDQGKWFLAATLLHELYHVCAPTMAVNERELNAENAVERCRLYAPLIDSLSVRRGAVGSQVTITGLGFGPVQNENDRVELGGVTCPVVSWVFDRAASSVAITVTIPEGAATGMLRVINNNVRSNARRFTVI